MIDEEHNNVVQIPLFVGDDMSSGPSYSKDWIIVFNTNMVNLIVGPGFWTGVNQHISPNPYPFL